MRSIVETDFNYWNFETSVRGLELCHEVFGIEVCVNDGYVVAVGKDEE